MKREAIRAMPAKRDAATELAEKMLRALEAQHDLGPSSYPPTLRQLAEQADSTADTQTVQKAVKKKAFLERAIVFQPKNLNCPVCLVEDADKLAASSALLEYLLESLCTTTSPAVDVPKLKKKAPAAVKEAFEKALDRRIAENALPPGVAVITAKKKQYLHLERYPLPRKPEEVLAEELVKVLQAQRQLGTGAYPTTLARLIELTRPAADNALVKKATAQATFRQAVVLAMKSETEAPVALAGDLGLLADSPQLLETALRRARSETHQAFALAELKAKVVKPLQEAFLESINRRVADGQFPPGVGRLLQKKGPLLFFVSDIVSGRTEPPQTLVAASEPAAEFARAFDETFRRLDEQRRSHNFVSLLELRRGLPFDRQAFDVGLRELRRAGRYTLSAAEGRQGVSHEEQEAGIIEDGALLLYVSRKLS